MSLSCDLVMDFVSIYKDGAASEESRRDIDEHLKTCAPCRRFYAAYREPCKVAGAPAANCGAAGLDKGFEYLSGRLKKRRNLSVAAIAAIVCLSAAVSVFCTARMLRGGSDGNASV